jgi:hypothetical protein
VAHSLLRSLTHKLVFNRISLVAVVILTAMFTWWAAKPKSNPGVFLRDSMLDSIANRIKAQMPRPFVGKAIVVTDLGGDVNEIVTKGIRDRLSAQQGSVVPSEFLNRVLRQIGLFGKPVTRLDDALHVARETGVEGVLFGEVVDQGVGKDSAHLKLDLRWADKSTGQAVYLPPVEADSGGSRWSASYWNARMLATPIWPRILIWLAVTLLLPLATSPLIRRLTAEQSNTINFAILAVATTLDAALAFFLLGFSVSAALPALLLLAAFAISIYYNSVAVNAIDEYRD